MPTSRRKAPEPWWSKLPTEELLDLRFCDLGLNLAGTALQQRILQLHDELSRQGLVFRPYVWLSTDWFTPEGSTGFAIPFYLAHRRLVRLEHTMMFEAEGSSHDYCMRLLRHETAHAMDNAYRLHARADWRATFGRYSAPYRAAYRANPNSRNYVQNLGMWYAQSHPAEDYAESFAVWLAPQSRWQKAYADWPALRKLQRLDQMLRDIGDQPPPFRSRDRVDSLPRLRLTLREHYRRRQAAYGVQQPWRHDRELQLLFQPASSSCKQRAAALLRRERPRLRLRVAALLGQPRYMVDQALDAMEQRCRQLDLRVAHPRAEARLGAAVLATLVALGLLRGQRARFRR